MSETEQRHKCPEWNCTHKFREEELRAHLQWDHNRNGHEVSVMIEDLQNNE